jgi:hypothetical protein
MRKFQTELMIKNAFNMHLFSSYAMLASNSTIYQLNMSEKTHTRLNMYIQNASLIRINKILTEVT